MKNMDLVINDIKKMVSYFNFLKPIEWYLIMIFVFGLIILYCFFFKKRDVKEKKLKPIDEVFINRLIKWFIVGLGSIVIFVVTFVPQIMWWKRIKNELNQRVEIR